MTDLLEVNGISVTFGGLRALDEVSLAVAEGSVVGLIGPNGAGKTTLFNIVSGLQRSDSGTIYFDGQEMTGLPAERRAALGIGRSFQNLGLMLDESVQTNLLAAQHLHAGYRDWEVVFRPWCFWRREHELRRRATAALEAFGLAACRNEEVADLSFAAARFVELACVLVEAPRLMLLDEPTTGLDPREVAQLLAMLDELRRQGTTILLVAHDVRFVMAICDFVYVLSEGRLLYKGLPDEVQQNAAVIEAYLGRPAA